MSQPLIVIGHKNPDTDSICSAMAYAYLKEKLTGKEVVAGRCGAPNKETSWVLNYWGVEPPQLIPDVFNRVTDILSGGTTAVLPSTPIREVGTIALENDLKTFPIVDEDGHLVGLVTTGDIAQHYLSNFRLTKLETLKLTLGNMARTLGGRFLVKGDPNMPLTGKVVIGVADTDSIVTKIDSGDIVILGDRADAQIAALNAGAGCLIITHGYPLDPEAKKVAIKNETPVLSVAYDTFGTARLIDLSAPIQSIMHHSKDVIAFKDTDLVEDVRKKMIETRFRRYPVVDKNGKFLGTINRNNLLEPRKKQVIMVDHNEKSQAVDGIEQAQILEVVDHHRLGDISTGEPIYFRNEPVGCSSTIVASIYDEQCVEIPKEIAGMMASAILSDTVIFKSPTCTPKDKAICEKLCKIAGIDPYEYGRELFKAGSSLAGRTPEQIVFEDFKAFPMGDYKVGIGQVSTMDLDSVRDMLPEILATMEKTGKEKGFHQILLMVTDILAEGTELVVVGDRRDMVERAFDVKLDGDTVWLEGVMSRKKQIVPQLTAVFSA